MSSTNKGRQQQPQGRGIRTSRSITSSAGPFSAKLPSSISVPLAYVGEEVTKAGLSATTTDSSSFVTNKSPPSTSVQISMASGKGLETSSSEQDLDPDTDDFGSLDQQRDQYFVDQLFSYRSFVLIAMVIEALRIGAAQTWMTGLSAWPTTVLWTSMVYPPLWCALTIYMLAKYADDDADLGSPKWKGSFASAIWGSILLNVVEWILWTLHLVYVMWIWIDGSTGFTSDHVLVVFTLVHIMAAFAIRVTCIYSLVEMQKALRLIGTYDGGESTEQGEEEEDQ